VTIIFCGTSAQTGLCCLIVEVSRLYSVTDKPGRTPMDKWSARDGEHPCPHRDSNSWTQ